ncbi:shadow of prion protein [Protopterus annectens]|uniref:shadow of prion protein n=1 Tax=Protopterus annectens TaxID=7888 RepID=UPI001CFBA1E9|nr:shadow of prion protein [Protopterus annectens]
MNRATATCWMVILLAAFICENVISKGGRGGARGAARGAARGTSRSASRTRVKSSTRYGSSGSALRVAAAAAAGAAAGVAAGAGVRGMRRSSDFNFDANSANSNKTSDDYSYSAWTSAANSKNPVFATVMSLITVSHLFSYLAF